MKRLGDMHISDIHAGYTLSSSQEAVNIHKQGIFQSCHYQRNVPPISGYLLCVRYSSYGRDITTQLIVLFEVFLPSFIEIEMTGLFIKP